MSFLNKVYEQYMAKSLTNILKGYRLFRKKYALGTKSMMYCLSYYGQQPEIMVVACCDSRVDPALILQCEPGDLFVVRNVANIIPPYATCYIPHDTSVALEFGIMRLKVKHLILLGHSQCCGIKTLLNGTDEDNDFIARWVYILKTERLVLSDVDEYAKLSLIQSYQNCLTFPWILNKVIKKHLSIHLWFFDISTGQLFSYFNVDEGYVPIT